MPGHGPPACDGRGNGPAAAAPPAAPAGAPASAEKTRFGINSLINRMTGQGGEPAPTRTAATRVQPRVTHAEEERDELGAEHERIEIPAFLRRQAN